MFPLPSYNDLLTMIGAFGLIFIGIGWIIWMMPIGECEECPHCRRTRLERFRKDDAELDSRRNQEARRPTQDIGREEGPEDPE